MLGLLAAGVLGNLAGGAAGMLTSKLLGGEEADPFALSTYQNNILQKAMDRSIQAGMQSFGGAQSSLDRTNAQARRDLLQGQKQAERQQLQGYMTARALSTPYRNLGLQSADKYASSLGLAIPKVGSQAVSDALFGQQMVGYLNNQYGGRAPTNPGAMAAPNYNALLSGISPQQIQQYMQMNAPMVDGHQRYKGVGMEQMMVNQMTHGVPPELKNIVGNAQAQNLVRQQLANQQLAAQQQAYGAHQNSLNTYNQYQNQLQQIGWNPQQQQIAQQYGGGLFS